MQIELLKDRRIERNGQMHLYKKHTVVNIGRMDAERLIASGEAKLTETFEAVARDLPPDTGIVALADFGDLATQLPGFPIRDGSSSLPTELPYNFALLLSGGPQFVSGDHGFRRDFLRVGFRFIEHWQMAVPLWSYTELACHIGTETDREKTKAVIRDLRVPVYDPRVVFMRKCEDTERFLRTWKDERASGDENRG